MVFRNDFAAVSYRPPSVIFAPYRHEVIQAVARELDPIFKRIVDAALGTR
jgi:hypothetical protein